MVDCVINFTIYNIQVNTFQAALVYNGEMSFVFFFYDRISISGLRAANIGFGPSFGDISAVPFNFPDVVFGNALSSITEGSNTGSAGFYAYRVDMGNIIQPNGQSLIIKHR